MIPERTISGAGVSGPGKKFEEFLVNHTAAGPLTVNKYMRILRALLKQSNSFEIESAARFCKQKNRTYVRAAVVKYIEFLEHIGGLPEWGPGSRDFLVKKLPKVHEPPRRARKLPASEDLLEAVKRLDKDNRLAAMFMFYTGARSEEAMGVRLKDIDFEAGDVTIFGKGKVEKAPRIVKPPREYLDELKGYLGGLGILGGEYVFNPDSHASLESRTRMFRAAWGKVCQEVLGRTIGAHDFRRFAGTTVYEATGDAKAAKDFLGHSRIETTMRYIEYADKNRTLEKGRDIMAGVGNTISNGNRGQISRPERLERGRK